MAMFIADIFSIQIKQKTILNVIWSSKMSHGDACFCVYHTHVCLHNPCKDLDIKQFSLWGPDKHPPKGHCDAFCWIRSQMYYFGFEMFAKQPSFCNVSFVRLEMSLPPEHYLYPWACAISVEAGKIKGSMTLMQTTSFISSLLSLV